MALTLLGNIFKIGNQEYGYNPAAFYPVSYGGSVEVTVPLLTGNISATGSDTIQAYSLFSNAVECKPVYTTKVVRKKTITAKLEKNCMWLNKITPAGLVPANTQFLIDFVNGNINEAYLTTK